jgi:ferredoxin
MGWTRRGTIDVNMVTMETSVEGIFAAGDAVTGPATVIEAIGGGKRAAEAIDRYLLGIPQPQMPPVPVRRRRESCIEVPASTKTVIKRPTMDMLNLDRRRTTFQQVELGYTENMVREEARRCLRCDICRRCGRCVEVCRDKMGISALEMGYLDFDHPGLTDLRVTEERCITCGACAANCPTGAMQIEDRGDERLLILCGTILNRQKLVFCSSCGKAMGPKKYLDFINQRVKSVGKCQRMPWFVKTAPGQKAPGSTSIRCRSNQPRQGDGVPGVDQYNGEEGHGGIQKGTESRNFSTQPGRELGNLHGSVCGPSRHHHRSGYGHQRPGCTGRSEPGGQRNAPASPGLSEAHRQLTAGWFIECSRKSEANMRVQDVIKKKRRVVHTIPAQRTAEDAIVQMTVDQPSALIVMDGRTPVGIFTERDVLRCHVAWRHRLFREMPLSEAMTDKSDRGAARRPGEQRHGHDDQSGYPPSAGGGRPTDCQHAHDFRPGETPRG